MSVHAPSRFPCASCPYRRDVPSGVWHESEYEKLPAYDNPTPQQPQQVFMCHQGNGRICSGWAGCHDMSNALALRFLAAFGQCDQETLDAIVDYESPVPLFDSGTEAAEHGLRELEDPGVAAQQTMRKLAARKERRG